MSPISNAPKFRLPKLKVKPARPEIRKPCAVEMASLLSCWASSGGPDAEMCVKVADTLKLCMTKPKQQVQTTTTINYHLARLSKYL
ncbi:mitochondrial ribosomal protein subunit Mrp10 [Saitoella complicata NRRL Y-17804]|uniref:mitochondrial ribosomal protein subunit Mrp10 n=1 Tax=Saitoella complicata (strain BCRC 22490 / CBS 7301 / JCM 7358 / NBRC 10748 / NRRL Y-17804) TaxID=698492 RepID=UPI000867BD30|nr:mitochondrial ribosomal protein subunit Mrp10 [Saitoella complicata NRRL Y-17804]ODQ52679.1 mitochondrial ribosomal protein subunit Mrp10 [Saitoella complicata NRRL Y-17804]